MSELDLDAKITASVRRADEAFQKSGGSSRHWVRECLLPSLESDGLSIVTTAELLYFREKRYYADGTAAEHDALIAELRKLREENARLKAPVDTKGIERSCDDCQQPYAVWFAPNETWNFVMGGADCKGDPGGMLCPRCFTLRAEAAGVVPTAWEVRPERFLDEENRWRAGRKG